MSRLLDAGATELRGEDGDGKNSWEFSRSALVPRASSGLGSASVFRSRTLKCLTCDDSFLRRGPLLAEFCSLGVRRVTDLQSNSRGRWEIELLLKPRRG